MKLVSAQIFNYKNILNSAPVEIQPDVTCLVGKNESGKTAYLNALYRLKPARPNAVFNVPREYPAWLEKRHRMEGKNLAAVAPVVAEFILEAGDIAKLDGQFGMSVLQSPRIRVSRMTTRGETFVLRRHHNPTVTASKCDFSWARADINRLQVAVNRWPQNHFCRTHEPGNKTKTGATRDP
jgi:hypothetical protein